MPLPAGRESIDADIAVIGAGSATNALVHALTGAPSVVVFEGALVGGTCPFDACIPSKSLIHDGAIGRSWSTAGERRRELVHHHDDESHAASLKAAADVRLVRERARLASAGLVLSDSYAVRADHVVIATGAVPVVPDIEGLDAIADRTWSSGDALRTSTPPARLLIAGGGVTGCELARLFSSFGTDVVLLEPEDQLFGELQPEVADAVSAAVARTATIRTEFVPTTARRHGDGVAIVGADGEELRADRLLLATGRRPQLEGIGLESLGVPSGQPLPLDERGRVRIGGSVWAIGDVCGREQYTHAAVHHGRVVADHLTGAGTRRFDDVVSAACMFVDPPMMTVGPSCADTADDDDVVWATAGLDVAARAATDESSGVLALAGRRTTGLLVGGHGIGQSFDELVHALIVAVDGQVPIERLLQSMVPFPTMGDVFHAALSRLRRAMT